MGAFLSIALGISIAMTIYSETREGRWVAGIISFLIFLAYNAVVICA